MATVTDVALIGCKQCGWRWRMNLLNSLNRFNSLPVLGMPSGRLSASRYILNSIMENDQFFQSAGQYIAHLLRIEVKTLFNRKKDDTPNLFVQSEVSTFFHEFIHHVQNISTIQGLSHFESIIALWHNIRAYVINPDDSENNKQIQISIQNIKYRNKNNNLPDFTSAIEVQEIKKVEFTDLDLRPIKIKIRVNDSDEVINFGIYEFLESAAYTLERLFVQRIGLQINDNQVNTIPYKIGDAIFSFFNKEMNSENLMRSALLMQAALQHAAPHKAYILLLQISNISSLNTADLKLISEKISLQWMESNGSFMSNVSNSIDAGFPLHDPFFGDVVKSVKDLIIYNIRLRQNNPFPEIKMITSLDKKNYQSELNTFVDFFGGCYIIRPKKDSTSECDIFTIGKNSIFTNHRPVNVFQCSIDFSLHHISSSGIQSPLEREIRRKDNCPLMTHCTHSNKVINLQFCKDAPWKNAQAQESGDKCPYQVAVYNADLKNLKI